MFVIAMFSKLPEETEKKLENLVVDEMMQLHIPGLGLALVKDDQVIYAKGFGARNIKDNLPATPQTLFGVGSLTKSFTALAIMQLVEQGKLDVQDPVNKYLPISIGRKENPITIHHLLTHSSGIPNLGVIEVVIGKLAEIEEKSVPMSSLDDLLFHINGASDEVVAEPGKRFFYFNEGYCLLSEIVEKISKTRFEVYIKEKILKPLKMYRSTFLKEEFEKDCDIMTPYRVDVEGKDGTLVVTPTQFTFHKLMSGPGGLLTSVMELSNYLVANMNKGVFEETKILDATLLEQMHNSQIGTENILPQKKGYGYGWGITENFSGHKTVGHTGGGVSSAHFSFVPDLKIGVAVAVNADTGCGHIVLSALALMMDKDPLKEVPFFEADKKLSILAGEYASYKKTYRFNIVKRGGYLYFESKEKYWLAMGGWPLIPEDEKLENLKFYIPSAPALREPLEFVVDSSGKVDLYYERNRFHKIR
jgi:CubicO group peptidase (beta-lactamase class C family)